jgi:hypothetical protein
VGSVRGSRAIEAGGGYSDDGHGIVVHQDLLADHVAVAGKASPSNSLAENYTRMASEDLVVILELKTRPRAGLTPSIEK